MNKQMLESFDRMQKNIILKENADEAARFKKVEAKPDRFRHIDLTKEAQKDLNSDKGYKGYRLVPVIDSNNKATLTLMDVKSSKKINTPDGLDLYDTVAVLKYINNMFKDNKITEGKNRDKIVLSKRLKESLKYYEVEREFYPSEEVFNLILDQVTSQGGSKEEAETIAYALAQSSYEYGNGREYTVDLYEIDITDTDDFLPNIDYYLRYDRDALELFKKYYSDALGLIENLNKKSPQLNQLKESYKVEDNGGGYIYIYDTEDDDI